MSKSSPISKTVSSTLARFRSLRAVSNEAGMAAVEFSLILPILVVLWVGGVEVTSALSLDRRLNNLASSMGDLVARTKQITEAEIQDIFNLAEPALFPHDDTGIAMRITAVDIDDDGAATVGWTMKQGTLPGHIEDFEDGDLITSLVPEDLLTPESQIIMAEAYQTYTPAIGYTITGEIDLDDRMFFVPRLVTHVALCEDENDDDCDT